METDYIVNYLVISINFHVHGSYYDLRVTSYDSFTLSPIGLCCKHVKKRDKNKKTSNKKHTGKW